MGGFASAVFAEGSKGVQEVNDKECGMAVLISLPAVLSLLLLGAHLMHNGGSLLLVAGCVGLCTLLFSRKRWSLYIVQAVLALAAIEWLFTTYAIVQMRQQEGQAWVRAAGILIGVACLNVDRKSTRLNS